MKRGVISIIFGAVCLLTAGCTSTEVQTDNAKSGSAETEKPQVQTVSSLSDERTSRFSIDGQEFQLSFLHNEVLDFAKTVKADSSLVIKEVYGEKVIDPLYQRIADSGAQTYYELESLLFPNTNPQKLEVSTKELMVKEEDIADLIEEALEDSSGMLPGLNKTIIAMPVNPLDVMTIESRGGVNGLALSENLILLQVSPSFDEDILKFTVAMLYHTTVQTEYMADMYETLMESFVVDGKAAAFAHQVYPETAVSWTQPLSDELMVQMFEELKESGNDLDHYWEFEGSARRGIPPWTNFKLGYEITQSYLRNHPEAGIEEWTSLLPLEIINGSDYIEKFRELQTITD
ncbi:hypothetical protein D3H55_10435 [Bacillus salacetis]|uniref:DUF2268 domain-containing protein n=1 Tax=Bacillus salacetis TaxID=2315464 RepID=A0A3A1R1Z2_9BACI|nr:DUF2268 domain-containing putative Zn-dependent protease [Bacillus salacetis]RIW34005.1 hypothetical protein D3H55_10435 [Bacillus salacetis]